MTAVQAPEELREFLKNPHFSRYYHTWQKNERSLVFIPLTEYFRSRGLLHEALSICEKGLSFNPKSVTGRLALVRIYMGLERRVDADLILKGILEELPGQQEALLLLAELRQEEPTEVASVTTPAEPLTPWDTCTMAAIYARQGDMRRALGIVEKILAFEPSHVRAKELREEWRKCRSSSSMVQT